MDDFYKDTKDYNPNRKRKIIIVFDVITPNKIRNKTHNQI